MRRILIGSIAAVSFLLVTAGVSFAKGGPGGGGQGRGSGVSKTVQSAHEEGLKGQELSKKIHKTQAEDMERGSDVSRAVHKAQSEGLKGQELAGKAREAAGAAEKGGKGKRHKKHH